MVDRPKQGRRRRRSHPRVIALEAVPASRMRWVFALLCFGLVGLMGRMAWLQVVQASALEARARSACRRSALIRWARVDQSSTVLVAWWLSMKSAFAFGLTPTISVSLGTTPQWSASPWMWPVVFPA